MKVSIYNDSNGTYMLSLQVTGFFESGSFYSIAPAETASWDRNPNNGTFDAELRRPDNTVVKHFTMVVVKNCTINMSDMLNYANDVLITIA
jgi:hypothetical protein